jgi:D-amino peptidase
MIACDMEGISGVVENAQVTPGTSEYERARKIMTDEVNAVVKGAVHAGAEDVLVVDGHWNGTNILIEQLDAHARLVTGKGAPLGMVQGLDSNIQGLFFIGYHARRGVQNAVLDHTFSTACISNLWLNGKLTGEIGMNAALAGHFDVPLVMISGDQTACAEAVDLVPNIETAVVKQARGRFAAECLPLEAAHMRLRETAGRALNRVRSDMSLQPYKVQPPILVVVEYVTTEMADRVSLLPGTTRLDGVRVQFTAPDMIWAYRWFRSALTVAQA